VRTTAKSEFSSARNCVNEETPEAAKARRLEGETTIGKAIFYITVAMALWFFYGLNGIECPC